MILVEEKKEENFATRKPIMKFASKAQPQESQKITLDSSVSEKIDLEESFIEIKNILKKKRLQFLKFCEEKVRLYF